jgi:uncharacterized protein (DUF111 family)
LLFFGPVLQNNFPAQIGISLSCPAAMHIQLDPLGGIAGDMFIAAVLNARPSLAKGLVNAVHATGIPQSSTISVTDHGDASFVGTRFSLTAPDNEQPTSHRRFQDIVRQLRAAPLELRVCSIAIEVLELLAQAEGNVHGVAPDDVTFHEVGAWDSIADVVQGS